MPVALYRIDDRLIHGQVVESWVPYLKIAEIVVVSDDIASDDIRRTIMRFSTPEGVELKILKVQEAFDCLNGAPGPQNILVLLPGLKEAADLLSKGLKIPSLNIGGMHYCAGKNISIGRAIFLSDEDCGYLKFLAGAGVGLEGRGVPNDKPINPIEALL
ncbi:MAG: PTS sugar transporter subunit IIB [Elusimicrobia bacterium]|nr:PTS sugar transporter subunit IIB [Elusimicrobiota bacterium]